jgi:multidrug resistance efflux pump
MGQTTDQIESDIERNADQLKSNLEELETRVKSAADWRSQFDRHPERMTVAALVGGALLALLVGGGSSRRH